MVMEQLGSKLFGRDVGEAVSIRFKNKALQYWKKCSGVRENGMPCSIHTQDLGWVTTGPVMTPLTANEYSEFSVSKHATPLPQYGAYEVGNVKGQEYNITDQYSRFRAILDKGGLMEFPIDQMVAYGWHRTPIRDIVPELQNFADIRCEMGCANRLFISEMDYINHCSVMHKETEAPKAIGKEFSKALENIQGLGSFNTEQMAQMLAMAMTMAKQMETGGLNITTPVTTEPVTESEPELKSEYDSNIDPDLS